jgi:hypothetical protein
VVVIRTLFALFLVGCGGPSEYQGKLTNGMSGTPLASVRIVAKASPIPPDLTCQVREATTAADGTFTLTDLCRNQNYVMSIPAPTLQMEGNTVVSAGEVDAPFHSAWRCPDGHGVYRLQGESIASLPTFADVASDEAKDGTKVRYPEMKPTGKVITIGEGDFLILAGKRTIQKMQLHPLVAQPNRVRLKGDIIRDHVFIGVSFDAAGNPTPENATVDDSKVTDVLIRGEGMRFMAHDALPAGRYALLGDKDSRVTILDFGESQVAK